VWKWQWHHKKEFLWSARYYGMLLSAIPKLDDGGVDLNGTMTQRPGNKLLLRRQTAPFDGSLTPTLPLHTILAVDQSHLLFSTAGKLRFGPSASLSTSGPARA
jgi:hypothetical protein